MKTLLIFDAFNYFFRAYYASPPMSNSQGFPTNALHLFSTMVLGVIRRVHPDFVAMAIDASGPKFRHRLYPDYKAQRETPPEALLQQLPYLVPLIEALGLPYYQKTDYEADDVIASLTKIARQKDIKVVIASSDKDLMQLIEPDEAVILLDAMGRKKNEGVKIFGYAEVLARFQVPPRQVADVLALAGDAVDNIPGCKGIGEKTAGKLIASYGSLENLMAKRHEITKPAQKANLEAFSAKAALSKALVSLVDTLALELQESGLDPKPEALTALLSALELRTVLREVLGPEAKLDPNVERISLSPEEEPSEPSAEPSEKQASGDAKELESENGACEERPAGVKPSFRRICQIPMAASPQPLCPAELTTELLAGESLNSLDALDAFLEKAEAQEVLALMPIWQSTQPQERKLYGIALATEGKAASLILGQRSSLFDDPIDTKALDERLFQCFAKTSLLKVVYDLKAWLAYALAQGQSINIESCFDVELAAYLLHPERRQLNLETLALEYLAFELAVNPSNFLGSGKKSLTLKQVPKDLLCKQSSLWAQLILAMAPRLRKELKYHQLWDLYEGLDRPLCIVLAEMEFTGIRFDGSKLKALNQQFSEALAKIQKNVEARQGKGVNLNSPSQVGEYLYKTLGLKPSVQKRRSHGYSTDQESLEALVEQDPIVLDILEYRRINKLSSSYGEALGGYVDAKTKRIHGRFNACVTATTRLSSSDPNLQNIPNKTELGNQIRDCFVPEEGYSFVCADYSQIELRLLAHFSRDPMLVEAFQKNIDIHLRTAAALFDLELDQISKAQRQLGKTINFGLIYGMGSSKLARETGYSKQEAKHFLDKFHSQFPTLSHFIECNLKHAMDNGESRTLLGHRRSLPELYSSHPHEQAFGERIALNAPIQGSGADVIKLAMLKLRSALLAKKLPARLLVQVHDDLLLECRDDAILDCATCLKDCMQTALTLSVPLLVEVKVGKSWAQLDRLEL